MPYSITTRPRVPRQISSLPPATQLRIEAAIDALAQNPRPSGSLKLSGRDFWRIRAGDYRVIYAINDGEQIVTVVRVGHRRDIYRNLSDEP